MRPIARPLLLATMAAIASPAARADWLDLPDGLYDISLSCVQNNSLIPCPSPFHASLTVSGAGASAMSTSINGQAFSGDPIEDVATFGTYSYQLSTLIDVPYSFITLASDLSPAPATNAGLTNHWWYYCAPSSTGCRFDLAGSWVARAVSSVPEPSTTALIALSLTSLAVVRRSRLQPPSATWRRAAATSPAGGMDGVRNTGSS